MYLDKNTSRYYTVKGSLSAEIKWIINAIRNLFLCKTWQNKDGRFMKDNNNGFSYRKIWLCIIVPVLSIILNALVSDIQESSGLLTLIVSLLFVAMLLTILLFFHSKMILNISSDIYTHDLQESVVAFSRELLQRIKTEQDISDSRIQDIGIIPEHKLAEIESTNIFEEIWVVSNDLSAEVGQYIDIVPNNLERGIKYKFFYQNTNQNSIRVAQLKRRNNYSTNAEYYPLSNDFFFIVTNLDFTIYNPFSETRVGYMGMELPQSKELYAVRVNSNLTDAIASKLLSYVEAKK